MAAKYSAFSSSSCLREFPAQPIELFDSNRTAAAYQCMPPCIPINKASRKPRLTYHHASMAQIAVHLHTTHLQAAGESLGGEGEGLCWGGEGEGLCLGREGRDCAWNGRVTWFTCLVQPLACLIAFGKQAVTTPTTSDLEKQPHERGKRCSSARAHTTNAHKPAHPHIHADNLS